MKYWGILGIVLVGLPVWAGEIKAIVNDTPISAFDVESRAKMIMLQQAGRVGKLTDDLRKEALDDLIDERIKMQEIAKQQIQVSDEEVAEALAHLEAQNGLPSGGFRKMMAEQGVPYQTLVNQTAANLGWLRVMQKAGRTLTVKPAEIQARHKVIKKELSRESISFAEIVMPTEEEALTVWQRLQDGADFGTMVELHSTADSRVNGGRVSGVTRNYYGADVAEILDQMQVGQLSRPIPVSGGYALILMLNKREAVRGDTIKIWELAQAIVPPDSIANTLLQQPVKGGCKTFVEIVKDDAVAGSLQQGRVSPAQLPTDILQILKKAKFKTVAGPMQTPAGLLYFMKCSESEERVMPTDAELQSQLESEKMELISRQLLSEIKRDVVIEYK
ncbi:MAG: peptidylprolyl isomerase [Alphaproteobacteria bacterium]|nr:peptidylprolyl isomerase [Alphaproteobacteria bacterium]